MSEERHRTILSLIFLTGPLVVSILAVSWFFLDFPRTGIIDKWFLSVAWGISLGSSLCGTLLAFSLLRMDRQSHERIRSSVVPTVAVTVGLVMTLTLLAAVPLWRKWRQNAERNACMGNLYHLELGKNIWITTNNITNGAPADMKAILQLMSSGELPWCPTYGSNAYSFGSVGQPVKCKRHGALQH